MLQICETLVQELFNTGVQSKLPSDICRQESKIRLCDKKLLDKALVVASGSLQKHQGIDQESFGSLGLSIIY